MLINALHDEETRIAIAEDDRLLELEIERQDQNQLKGNIYLSTITRIEPSLQAAFLDIGSTRNGFLQINDIHPSYFNDWPPENGTKKPRRPDIKDVLRAGQNLVVQVVKDEREAKGATLTTNLSMPGRYLVLMVGNQRGGVSRKIVDEGQRRRLKSAVQDLQIPAGMGVIVRTAGINKSAADLQRDLDSLLDTWYEIVEKSSEKDTPKLLYQESDLAIRTVRDYLTSDVDEILIDSPQMFARVEKFVGAVMPNLANRVKLYDNTQPLFSAFHLDKEVDQTNQPEITLPSGGSIVINSTEAIVAVDVNSGRATGQADVEETAFATNKEAAVEVAKQLRLRDLGGLVVIDFIDMNDRRHKQTVEKTLKEAVKYDKAKVEMGRISKFGLLEMSRQRLKASLASQNQVCCPYCTGRGWVKTSHAVALEVLRKIESVCYAGGVESLHVRITPTSALFLLNNKRQAIVSVEEKTGVSIVIVADGRMKPEEYDLELNTGKHDSSVIAQRQSESASRQDSGDRRSGRSSKRGTQNRRGGGRSGNKRGGGRSQGKSNRGRGQQRRGTGGRSRRSRSDNDRSSDRSKRSRSSNRKSDSNREEKPKKEAPTPAPSATEGEVPA